MPVTLDQILNSARSRISSLGERRAALEREAAAALTPPPLEPALSRTAVGVIAEVKRRSPSAGAIREDIDPAARAALYAEHGAAAISVLTDGPYFGGSLDDLRMAAARVRVPLLRKDFILDELQVVEARAAGASAVLLIVRALPAARLRALLRCTEEWQLGALVEIHAEAELAAALEAGARIIGVNSRDLDSFQVDTQAAWRLLERVPGDRIAVAESGMAGRSDVEQAAAAGADAVLIGTALSAAPSPEALLDRLTRTPRRGRGGGR